MYKIICLVIFLAMSLAADVTIYKEHNTVLMQTQSPLKFEYGSSDGFIMKLFIENKPASVTAVKAFCDTDFITFDAYIETEAHGWRTGQKYYVVGAKAFVKLLSIKLHLYTSQSLCSSVLVAEGMDHFKLTNEEIKELTRIEQCKYKNCDLVVDLKNECDDSPSATDTKENDKRINIPVNDFPFNSTTPRNEYLETTTQKSTTADDKDPLQFPLKNVYIISVIAIFIIVMVIIICVKRYCRRKSEPVETMEMNTNVTTNEVVYADLSLAHGDSQPPKRGEESTYAQIIGVLKPVDANVKEK